jgi:hypothetical protein
MSAVPHATLGIFCDNQPIGQATCGLFCDGDIVALAVDDFQGQYIDRFTDYSQMAFREDEEFVVLLRAIIKVIDPWD